MFIVLISSGSLRTLRKEGSLYETEKENTTFSWYGPECLCVVFMNTSEL